MSELESQNSDLEQEDYTEDYESDIDEDYDGDDYEDVEDDGEAEGDDESPAGLAPDSEPEHEENADDEEVNQDKINEIINMKHRKMREAQEEAERLRKQLEQSSQSTYQAPPEVPEMPDPFDDDYESKMQQREKALIARSQWEAQQQQVQAEQQRRQQALAIEQQRKMQEAAVAYAERAKKSGIKPEQLQKSAQVVAQYFNDMNPVHVNVTRRIIQDENGPFITQYLAAKPLEAMELAEMDETDAMLHIERKIKPKLANLKRDSKTPKPKRRKQSNGTYSSKNPLTSGGTFY